MKTEGIVSAPWQRMIVATAVVAAAVAIMSPKAGASDSLNVTVTATIVGVCKFNSGQTPTVTVANAGANIDPSLAGPATGNANILYRCTNGTTPTFTVPTPATVTCTTAGTCGSTTMAPTMTASAAVAGTGMGSGNDKTLTVTGQLTQAQYQNMQAGTYSGTITVQITP